MLTISLTKNKYAFDERLQKTNLILNRGLSADGVLIGSSRTTYIDPGSFKQERYFNYAVGNIFSSEYPGMVHAASMAGTLKSVVIGLDFYATNRNHPHHYFRPLEYYVANAKRETIGSLLSIDGVGYAWKSIRCTLRLECHEYYDRDFVKHMTRLPERRDRDGKILRQLELYTRDLYGASYVWDDKFADYLSSMKQVHPTVRFTAFTTPVSYPLFSLLVQQGRLEDYERWLRTTVAQWGSVWDFMGVNSVTQNLDLYVDAHHFVPEVGRWIANRMEGRDSDVPDDFGVLVTAANIDQHLVAIRRQALRADPNPVATFSVRIKEGAGQAL